MAEQRVEKSPPISRGKTHLPGQYLNLWSGEPASLGPQHADLGSTCFIPKSTWCTVAGRGCKHVERDAFVSWPDVSISNVWTSPFPLEVALLGKVQATPVPPVLKQKVCDKEKLLQVKCSWDPSCPAPRMSHGCWSCSRLHHGIAPACPSLQGASCPASGSLGTSQPAEGICRVQAADSSVWGCPQGSQQTSQVQRGGTVLGQRLGPSVQAETLCNSAGEVKHHFSSFCLGTDCPHSYKSSHVYSAVTWCTRKAEMKITDRDLKRLPQFGLSGNGERLKSGEREI